MAENTTNPSEPHKLDDAELDEVTGGIGYWSPWSERVKKRSWLDHNSGIAFEDWLKTVEDEDRLKARDAWLADGSPQDLTYYFDKGSIWTGPYVD